MLEGQSVTNLTRDTILHRVPHVRVDIDSSNEIRVLSDDKKYHLGPHGLAILDAFYQPVSVSEVLKKLSTTITGAQDWIDLVTTIVHLYEAGILQDATQRRLQPATKVHDFGRLDIHVRMLNDRRRTSCFLAGIAEVVSPGDIVVDIGTGTGVLAIAAARAGAEHVYAIEATAIGEAAQAVFEANGLTDRITLLREWSTRIDLPERADVLISEVIGNEPLGENVLETITDARRRLLKPKARMVPHKVRIFGLPVTIPDLELTKHTPTMNALRNWRSWYGIDFDRLAEVAWTRDLYPAFFIESEQARGWKTISEPILMAEIDLREVERPTIDHSVTVAANTSGQLNGLLVYSELKLGPVTRLSTHPAQVGKDNHWRNKVWVIDPLRLRPRDQFKVAYSYRATRTIHSKVAVTRAYSNDQNS